MTTPLKSISGLGVGARGLERLQAALEERGMSLGGDVPEPQPRDAVVTAGHTGEGAADLKTHPTDVSPAEFIDGLSPQRRVDDGRALLQLFARATEAPAVMWGSSMIGYGKPITATPPVARATPSGWASARGSLP